MKSFFSPPRNDGANNPESASYDVKDTCFAFPNDLPNINVNHKGVALIVSNDYKDGELKPLEFTHKDSEKMENFFTKLKNYIVTRKTNLSKKTFMSTCKYLGENFPGGYTRMVVYFAGHGGNGYILMQDGKERVFIKELQAIFNPCKASKMRHVVRIFFIDACRGTSKDYGCSVDEIDGTEHNERYIPVASQGKELVAFATIEDYVSYDASCGGIWTTCLYEELIRSEGKGIVSVLTAVNGNLRAKQLGLQGVFQTSEFISSLGKDEDIKFLDEAGNI